MRVYEKNGEIFGDSIKKYYLCSRKYVIGRWCNGNTTGFGSVIPGSNPSRPTIKNESLLALVFFVFHLSFFILKAFS